MIFFNHVRSKNNPDLLFVRVARDAKDGFWEVDLKQNKALFRNKKQKLLPSDNLHDYTGVFNSIKDFLINQDGVYYVKEVVKDRKVVFSESEICQFLTPNPHTGVPIHCTMEAMVWHRKKAYCKTHAANFITL